MPDTRKHRGPHPADAELFAPAAWPALRQAVAHCSWLLTRGYAAASTLKLVGDRFQLTERQRLAVMRCSCSDQSRDDRRRRQLPADRLGGEMLDVDGFNVLTTIEAALSGGVILRGRDGCDRDLASMHGNYRKVEETRPALQLIGEVLAELGVAGCRWYLDRPVSNSGRLSTILREIAAGQNWNWQVELVNNPDDVLMASTAVAVSSDSVILDGCQGWFNLAREVIGRRIAEAWIVSLQCAESDSASDDTGRTG